MEEALKIWNAIVKEASKFQVLEGENKGKVLNPVIDDFYQRETAFAAKIFAAEFLRTNEEPFYDRAKASINTIEKELAITSFYEGSDEPVITPRGIKYRKGSIPATIILLEAALEASELLSISLEIKYDQLINYMRNCYIGNGEFYHDALSDKAFRKKAPYVVNTSAMIYYFLQVIRLHKPGVDLSSFCLKEIRSRIFSSIRGDGFFPYIGPGAFQKMLYYCSYLIPKKIIFFYDKAIGDKSVFFGDALHHCVALYYLLKGLHISKSNPSKREKLMICKAWTFVVDKFKYNPDDSISFDFTWEPKPRVYRHGGFIDTATYFYILQIMEYLTQLKLLEKSDAEKYETGLVKFIEKELLLSDREKLCISPQQGPESIIEKLIPRPAESVYKRGALMADFILGKTFANKNI